jgi:hypothetical protein
MENDFITQDSTENQQEYYCPYLGTSVSFSPPTDYRKIFQSAGQTQKMAPMGQYEPVITDPGYTQYYLRQQIGKRVKIEFLIGTNMLVDREGTLTDVGISYLVIKEVDTFNLIMCDMYSIKFVTIFQKQTPR